MVAFTCADTRSPPRAVALRGGALSGNRANVQIGMTISQRALDLSKALAPPVPEQRLNRAAEGEAQGR